MGLDYSQNHIFKVTIDSYFQRIKDDYIKILTEAELAKSLQYLKNTDRKRYIVSKYLSKILLSKVTNNDPSSIKFSISTNKKPAAEGIEFNISHSGNCLLITFSPSAVGIDIETINRSFKFETLLNECFSVEEIDFINSGEDKLLFFYTLWTRKEALLKATGEGLVDDLDQVTCLPSLISRLGRQYKLLTFIVDNNYVSTLAISNENSCNYWDCNFY